MTVVGRDRDRSGDCPVDSHPVACLKAKAARQGRLDWAGSLTIGPRLPGRARKRACRGQAGAARFVAGQIGQEQRAERNT